MMVAALLMFAQVRVLTDTGAAVPQPDANLGRAQAVADSFVRVWQYHWQMSQIVQLRLADRIVPPAGAGPVDIEQHQGDSIAAAWARAVPPADLRFHLWHCHPDGPEKPKTKMMNRAPPGRPPEMVPIQVYGEWRRLPEYMIESGVGKRTICPSWYQGPGLTPWDERLGLDASIIEPLQPVVRAARQRVLAALDSVAVVHGGDDWLSGQLVRFAIDQGDLPRASRAAARCSRTDWWCMNLRAYVEFASGRVARADSLFMRAVERMSSEARCAWTDVTVLLDVPDKPRYSALPCDERDNVNATFWWLADPLYTEDGNERRAEHFARLTLVTLRAGTQSSERWDLRDVGGGSAVRRMLVRYGWPALSVWGGLEEDRAHIAYLGGGSMIHERDATAEYAGSRIHTVPAFSALANPWQSSSTDWIMTERIAKGLAPQDTLWWPREHFARRGTPIAQLWDQSGAFRRDSSILLAIATDLDAGVLGYVPGDSLTGSIVLSAGEDSMMVFPQRAVAGGRAVFLQSIPDVPRVVSLELAGRRNTGLVARTRFGIEPPHTLAAMRVGEIAVSQPVFVSAPPSGGMPVTAPMPALSHMLGTTRFAATVQRVGVYWESYGIAGGDTASVTVRIEPRDKRPNVFRRLASRLGFGPSATGGVSVQWAEPSAERVVTTVPGRVPIQGRSVSIDLSGLAPGSYALIVSVARDGSGRASAERLFMVMDR
jgi:hypothetical protein